MDIAEDQLSDEVQLTDRTTQDTSSESDIEIQEPLAPSALDDATDNNDGDLAENSDRNSDDD